LCNQDVWQSLRGYETINLPLKPFVAFPQCPLCPHLTTGDLERPQEAKHFERLLMGVEAPWHSLSTRAEVVLAQTKDIPTSNFSKNAAPLFSDNVALRGSRY